VKRRRPLPVDEGGVAAVEMALALPILVVMLYMFIPLGQGARYATLCLDPGTSGCTIPTGQQVHDRILATVYGIGPGTFNANTPSLQTDGSTGKYYDLTVTYSQPTSLLLFPGPTVNVSRSKRVWVAGT
jgi:hypothetical protein